jgi:hypothetical protein
LTFTRVNRLRAFDWSATHIGVSKTPASQRKIRQTGALATGGKIGQSGLNPLHNNGREDGLRSEVLR